VGIGCRHAAGRADGRVGRRPVLVRRRHRFAAGRG
jgi:hypothetical protein